MTAALPSPRVIAFDSGPALRWGIIGTGIAQQFVSAMHAHTHQRAVAVAARDPQKTRAFAAEHGIEVVHDDTSALVTDPNVDAVYISTPHPNHHALTLEAIAAGKHVLVEKPIAMSAAEAREMVDAGRRAGVLVMEAMWTRYLPQSDIIRQVLADGILGRVNIVDANFGFVAPYADNSRMWNKELGGGALLDAGVYPISFASSVLGTPTSITATGTMTSTGVDATAGLLLGHSDGSIALLATSMVSSVPTTATIMGSEGRIDVISPFFGPTGLSLRMGTLGTGESETWLDERFESLHEGMSHEIVAFASYVEEGRVESPIHPHDEVVGVMATIDEARRQVAELGHPYPTA
ncbi:Gfo/Idh/MocA family oxidoreductase [Humibacter soli]